MGDRQTEYVTLPDSLVKVEAKTVELRLGRFAVFTLRKTAAPEGKRVLKRKAWYVAPLYCVEKSAMNSDDFILPRKSWPLHHDEGWRGDEKISEIPLHTN
jgi:hypothetical protein